MKNSHRLIRHLRSHLMRGPRRGKSERGQTLILFVAIFTVLLGMAAFAIDQGMWLGHRRVAQKDADTAARAGAMAYLNANFVAGQAAAKARQWATANLAPTNANTTFVEKADCSGPYLPNGVVTGVPSIEAQVNEPQGSLFSRDFGFPGQPNLGANATACVGVPTSLSGSDPFFIGPGGPCFTAGGQPQVGQACVFKSDGGTNLGGNFGTLSLSDTSSACTVKSKKDLGQQIATGSQAVCNVGDSVNTATGDNSGIVDKGMNCRLAGQAGFYQGPSTECTSVGVSQPPDGEGYCDTSGQIPPFTGPSYNGIDDFTKVFSVPPPTGGAPDQNWYQEGPGGTPLALIPNVCSNGTTSPRIMTIIIAAQPCGSGCNFITVAGFATFYVFGCVNVDNKTNQVVGNIDVQCAKTTNNGIEGTFVKAYIPEGGGTPKPCIDSWCPSLSIFLVK